MGGPGSGNRFRDSRKSTVEESLSLTAKDFRGRLYPGATGSFTWTWSDGGKSSIDYIATGSEDVPVVVLAYRWGGKVDVRLEVRFQTTPTPFAGRRLWFTCPLAR